MKARRGLFITLVLLALALIAGLGLIVNRNLVDFPVYYAAGQSLRSGRTDLYAADFARGPLMDYRYLPLFLVSFIPLWRLPYPAAAFVWYSLEVFEIALSVWATRAALNWSFVFKGAKGDADPEQSSRVPGIDVTDSTSGATRIELAADSSLSRNGSRRLVWLVPFLAVSPYFVMVLHYGNAHLLAVALLFASLYLTLKARDTPAGLLMALSITIKLTPVLLLPYFAIRGRWKFLGVTAAFLLALNMAPAAYFGASRNMELAETWYRHVVASQEFHEENGPINLSIKGQLRRYLTHVDYGKRLDGDTRYPAVNVLSLGAASVTRLWWMIDVLMFAALMAYFFKGAKAPAVMAQRGIGKTGTGGQVTQEGQAEQGEQLAQWREERLCLEIGLMITAMLLLEPLTSKIYFISLLWPVACLAKLVAAGDARLTGMKWLLVAAAAANFVLPLLPGRPIQRLLLVLGADFYLTVLLFLALLYGLKQISRPWTGARFA